MLGLLPFNSTIVKIHLKAIWFPVTVSLCSMRDLRWMTLRALEYKELLTQFCKTGTKQDNRREIWRGTKRLHIECWFRQIINMQQNVHDDHFSTTREYLRLSFLLHGSQIIRIVVLCDRRQFSRKGLKYCC